MLLLELGKLVKFFERQGKSMKHLCRRNLNTLCVRYKRKGEESLYTFNVKMELKMQKLFSEGHVHKVGYMHERLFPCPNCYNGEKRCLN